MIYKAEARKHCEGIWWKTAKYKIRRKIANRKCSMCGYTDNDDSYMYKLRNGDSICSKCYLTILGLKKLLEKLKNNCINDSVLCIISKIQKQSTLSLYDRLKLPTD